MGRRLGQTRARQEAWGNAPVVCAVCGHTRRRMDFTAVRGQATPNPFCNACFKLIKGEAKRYFRQGTPRPLPLTHRRAAYRTLLARVRRANAHGKEVSRLSENEYAAKVLKFPDRVAAVVGKTYAVRGDAEEISSAEAVVRIVDMLNEIDETLIERNKDKRLQRGQR